MFTAGMSKQMQKVAEKAAADASRILGKAAESFFDAKALARMGKGLKNTVDKMKEAQARAEGINHRIEMAHDDDRLRSRLEQEKKIAESHLAALDKSFSIEEEHVEKIGKRLIAARRTIADRKMWQESLKGAGDMAQSFGDGIHGAFKDVAGKDIGMFGNMFKKAGALATKGTTAMETNTAGGAGGAAMASLGKVLSGLGPALIAIGGIALGFAAIVKVVLDADAKIKELNKEILAGGVSANDIVGDMDTNLGILRGAFSGLGEALKFNLEWGTSAKENVEILNAWGDAGMTIRELTGDIDDQTLATQRLQDANKQALIYSKLFGESAGKIAGDMASMAEETGRSLESVREKYSEIAAAAKESAFGTKRFFGMVLQLTSGMAMYNVRLSETLGMLTTLGKIMGPKKGAEMAADMAKGFKDTSTEDRLLMKMKMGGGRAQAIGALRATRAAGAFQETAGGVGGAQADMVRAVLQKAGLTGAQGEALSADEFAKRSSKLTQDQTDALTAALNGIKSTLGTQFAAQQQSSLALTKGGTVAAMSEFGPAETGLAKLYSLAGVLGKRLDQISQKDLTSNIAADKLSGMSPEARANAVGVARNVTGMQTNAAALSGGKGSAADIKNFNETQGKLFRVMIDETGKLVDMQGQDLSGKDEATFNKLYLNAMEEQKKTADEMKAQLTDDQQRAKQVVDNTQSISDKMDTVIESLLMSINETLSSFVNWFMGGQDKGDKKAKADAMSSLDKQIEALTKKMGEGPQIQSVKLGMKAKIAELREQKRVIAADTTTTGGPGEFDRKSKLKKLDWIETANLRQAKEDLAVSRGASRFGLQGEGAEEKLSAILTPEEQKKLEDAALKASEGRTKKIDDNRIPKITDSFKEAFDKSLADSARAAAIVSAVSGAGGTISPDDALALATNKAVSGDALDTAMKYQAQIQGAMGNKVPVHDAVMTPSGRVIIPDAGDTVAFGKPGGPLSKGGGGGSIINIHVYHDVSVPKMIKDAMEMVGR